MWVSWWTKRSLGRFFSGFLSFSPATNFKTEQGTPFSEETIKFRPHIVYTFFGPFNRPRRLLKGWPLGHFMWVSWWTKRSLGRFFSGFFSFYPATNFKTEQGTPFSEETIKFRPHILYTFFGPFNRPRRLLKGWHLFPFHSVYYMIYINFIFFVFCT